MYLNSIIKIQSTNIKARVVFESLEYLWLIDINKPSVWPYKQLIDELELLFNDGAALTVDDPFLCINITEGSANEKKRDLNYQLFKPMLADYEALFDKKKRNSLIKELVNQSEKPRIFYIRTLRRYWQRGMTPNAISPDYNNSGGKGSIRRKLTQKTGRKRTTSTGTGVIVDDHIANLFKLVINGFYLKNNKFSLTAAKDKVVHLYKSSHPTATVGELPTLRQFQYFYNTNYKQHEVIKKRTPAKNYDKDIRALTSTATYLNIGPGGRYEIDATIADLYLVSEKDPERIIGRPTIYMVKDVFSRMIVGMYVGLENPSWVTAMIAMSNAFLDKVEYCKEYGIDIESSQWPSVGLPASIMADKGELLHRQADVLVNAFNIQLSNSRSYRGDDKGIVEQTFHYIQAKIRPYVGGIVEPVNGKKRLGYRYELDAELNLKAFTEVIIHIVINHNNHNVISGYDFAYDMPEDLPANPIQLWNWGIKNRTGRLKPCKDNIVKLNLLPCEKGTTSNLGINFKGLFFTCSEAIAQGWFDRNKQPRPKKVDISFDPRRTNIVYLRPDSSYDNYWICELSDRSRRFKDMSFVDAASIFKQSNKTKAESKQNTDFEAPNLQHTIEKIAVRERNKKPSKSSLTNSQRLEHIRDNKLNEKELERDRTSVNLKEKLDKSISADVIDIKKKAKPENMDYPSLDEFLDDTNDD